MQKNVLTSGKLNSLPLGYYIHKVKWNEKLPNCEQFNMILKYSYKKINF